MSTQTQTIRKLPVQPGRTHDYLYDKVHILASERDHARATFKAHTGTSRVKQVPVYPSMFSELRHFPRFQMRLDVSDPVPPFINRQWPGYADQQREAMVRYKTFNYAPNLRLPQVKYDDAKVTGTNRYKYFRRPIIPFLQQVRPEFVLATARQDSYGPQDTFDDRPLTPPTRTVEIQTDYRDGEAQTEPYTPEYVIRPGEQPELLTLATLAYGRGLPAGLAEVEMIERARAKRAWEATLPPLSDTSQLDKRRKMMDEMETKEWALREQEIEKLQEQRLEVLKQLLRQREENQQNLNIRRLDNVWSHKQAAKDTRVKKIRKEHIKAVRKLVKRRRAVEGRLERRDVVNELSDFSSQSYAPLTRIGVFPDRGSEQYVVKSQYLSSYQGLLELEQSMPKFVMNPCIKPPKPRTVTKTGFIRRKQRQEEELRQLHEMIKELKTKGTEPPKPLRFLQKIEKPIPRPPTPSVEVPSEEEEEQELAVIFLQKIIRGRAIQNMMFEGKEKRMELIKELRSTHALQEAEQLVKKQDKQATHTLQRQRRLHEHKESFVDECLSQMEGRSVGSMLDFLTKELIRLQEERRIHAFAMLAERQRRLREAEESGRRQVEERRRREQDEIFKQVTKVHQMTVNTYLENIILETVDSTADEQARREVQEMASKINDVAYQLEDSRSKLESEEIVSELVHCFLLPEAQKTTVREKIHRQQRKYLLAAHKEIHSDATKVINDHSSQDGEPSSRTSLKSAGPESRPGSQTGRPGSQGGSQTSRPGSQAGSKTSHPGSQAGSRAGSQTSRPVSRAGSQSSRPGSQAGSQAELVTDDAEKVDSDKAESAGEAEPTADVSDRPGSETSLKEVPVSADEALTVLTSEVLAEKAMSPDSYPDSPADEVVGEDQIEPVNVDQEDVIQAETVELVGDKVDSVVVAEVESAGEQEDKTAADELTADADKEDVVEEEAVVPADDSVEPSETVETVKTVESETDRRPASSEQEKADSRPGSGGGPATDQGEDVKEEKEAADDSEKLAEAEIV